MNKRASTSPLARTLARIPLLAGLDEALLAELADLMAWREVAKKETVLFKGSTGDHLLFLLEGRLQVVDVTESGREIGLNLLLQGDYFGELSIIDGQPRSASVVAVDKSLVALLPKASAWELFHRNPLVAQRILLGLAEKLRSATNYQTILCLPNASQRVFALLQQLCVTGPAGLVAIDHPPKQHELAIMANTSRESVSRALKILLDERVVEKDRQRLIVRNPQALRRMALQDAGAAFGLRQPGDAQAATRP